MKQTMHTVEAQPLTVLSVRWAISAQITAMKLSSDTTQPKPVIIRIGLTDRLVMPSKARASIFFRG